MLESRLIVIPNFELALTRRQYRSGFTQLRYLIDQTDDRSRQGYRVESSFRYFDANPLASVRLRSCKPHTFIVSELSS